MVAEGERKYDSGTVNVGRSPRTRRATSRASRKIRKWRDGGQSIHGGITAIGRLRVITRAEKRTGKRKEGGETRLQRPFRARKA